MTAPPEDERLKSKLANFEKAFHALEASVADPVTRPRDLSGIIKDFEITYELSWIALKVFLEGQGHQTGSAKQTFAKAYQLKILNDEKVWLEMITDRNLTVHTYDEKFAEEMSNRIKTTYVPAFAALDAALRKDNPGALKNHESFGPKV